MNHSPTLLETPPLLIVKIECFAVKVNINNSDLIIFNVYIPPVSSCPQLFRPDLSSIFNHPDDDILVCGDFNAHHEAWDSSLADPRGDLLSDAIEISRLIILNDPGTPTCLPKSGSLSSPYLFLASAHVALAATWATHVNLNSDHLPITISLSCEDAPPPRAAKSYTNFQ